ncbi:hypothetical protein [Elizabethkingia anophelis]|uniref:hypothetical protein n=1 Tax=Elizabethkingia anophelis TaxID=1117645 RepID=UPI0012B3AF86|nr:hypothetical protein [Elizabethkingia anophelis]QGN22555.1 hypothetical protein GJV56_07890 [Elizabethkingia anophelis]QNV09207.1 hypothetical protein EIY88_07870 [Elizabethkingia anophelis]UTF90963.1 hypothetical protein J2N93_07935 [Elizabethkingia anophelis]UTG01833.1 hypothetical protein J2O04_07940 [Elizabethkingia anophelis]UTG05583.1 hypothetical protein J2O03_07935 [Elizabethkingia anophelis]
MENSGIQNEVIELGKLLVKELDLENSVDTLGRWMAHYIAEKIEAAENADEAARPEAEEECAKAILDLWHHRWKIQDRHQPLKDFSRLLELLRQMDPEAFDPYYYRLAEQNKKEEDNVWLTAAYDIDKATRVCLKYLLTRAAEAAASADSKAILEVAEVIGPDPDIMVIQTLLDQRDYGLEPENLKIRSEFNEDFRKQSLKNHVIYLERLVKHAEEVKARLYDQLNSSSDTSPSA